MSGTTPAPRRPPGSTAASSLAPRSVLGCVLGCGALLFHFLMPKPFANATKATDTPRAAQLNERILLKCSPVRK